MRQQVLSIPLGALLAFAGCHAEMSFEPPTAVSDAFKRDHPGAAVSNVEKENQQSGGVHYEYKYTDANGNKKTAEYDAQGNAVSGQGR
jgi:hypothetical protein